MDPPLESEIIQSNPIGNGLATFYNLFLSTCADLGVPASLDGVKKIDKGAEIQLHKLILCFQRLPAIHLLPSRNGRETLGHDLYVWHSRLTSTVPNPNQRDTSSFNSLLQKVIDSAPDVEIWNAVYDLVTQTTPSSCRLLPNLDQTSISFNTGSLNNSYERGKNVDKELKFELRGSIHVNVQDFYKTFFGQLSGLEKAAALVFAKCQKGNDPIYQKGYGWRDWPAHAKESDVLRWFTSRIKIFLDFAEEVPSAPKVQRRPLSQPNLSLTGSTAERKLDIGFMSNSGANEDSRCHWSQVHVPGELKSQSYADNCSATWHDLARYVREVFSAQDDRRFVLGFTLCGSIMRLWEFDRLGGVSSSPFDINIEGLQFVSVMLEYLWMSKEQLGFDPTIFEANGKRYINIVRDDKKERIVLVKVIKRVPCVAGRATTCWEAYREEDKSQAPLVVKDSWQYPEREEEGGWLQQAIEKGVVNVARYYHHETVCVGGEDDDICKNVRKGLDITTAKKFKPEASMMSSSERQDQSASIVTASRKRSSGYSDASAPPSKRTCSSSQTKDRGNPAQHNRVHRRVIVCDYGKPIYMATSRVAMLSALEGNIKGYESLHKQAGILQSDVSIGNLMMNEDGDASQQSFLIDLDLAIKEDREESSGARARTGTKAFMAIGLLLGKKHSYMHDLESFFWVLFWMCIHYNGPREKGRIVEKFEMWNYLDMEVLAYNKLGIVTKEAVFLMTVDKYFTPYYRPLIRWVNRLRKVVFPDGELLTDDMRLYSSMREILQEAQKDQEVIAE